MGEEFELNPFNEFCQQNSIIHETTTPYSFTQKKKKKSYSLEQNGIAKKKNTNLE